MRTILDLEDDILAVVEELAQQQGVSVGKALSDLARQALTKQQLPIMVRNGIPLFPVQPNAGIVTTDIVNQLRDENP